MIFNIPASPRLRVKKNQPVFYAALAACVLLCGCVTTTSSVVEHRHEVVYNPAMGIFTFKNGRHPSFTPSGMARALQSAGIKTGEEIHINMHQFHDQILITEIAAQLSKNGFHRYVFCTDQTAFSQGGFLKPLDKPATTAPPRREAESFSK